MKSKLLKICAVEIVSIVMLMSAFSVNAATKAKTQQKGYVEPESLYLKSLTIDDYEYYPEFNKNTTNYYISIPTTVNSLKVSAEAENENTTVKITGNNKITSTEGIVKIVLTKSGVTSKTYQVNVTKQADNGLKLTSLSIGNGTLSPDFVSTKYSYNATVTYKDNIENLNITATPNIEGAKIEILGNEKLKEGNNNVITILVTSGDKVTTYQVNALLKKNDTVITSNSNVIAEKLQNGKEKVMTFFEDENKKLATIVAGAVVLVVIIALIVIKKAKKRKVEKNRENIKKRVH